MEQLQQVEALIKQLKAIRGTPEWSSNLEDRLLRLLKLYEKLKNDQKDVKTETEETKSEPLVTSRPEGPTGDLSGLTSEQQAQVDGLVARGIPEEEARKAILGQKPFYQSEKQLFDPKKIPEIDKLQQAWDKLSPEAQNGFVAQSPWIAGAASFLDNLLPVSFLWALPNSYEAQVRNAIKENQGVADKAAMAGTIIGLVGGPLAAAKIARGGVKLLRKTAAKTRGHTHAAIMKKFRKEADEMIKEAREYAARSPDENTKAVLKQLTDSLEADRNRVHDLLEDWGRYIYEQKFTTEQTRNFLESRINDLPDGDIIKRITGGKADLFDTFWTRQPKAFDAPGGWVEELYTRLKHRITEIVLNIGPEIGEFIAGLSGDAAANYSYSFNDWKSQGFSDIDAKWLAFLYVIDRTPTDIIVEALDSFFGAGKGVKLVQIAVRFAALSEDLDAETGQVRPDVYGYSKKSERKANHSNQGGPVLDPKTQFYLKSGGKVGNKIKLLMSEGKPQKQAVAIALDYKRRGKL